MEMRCSLCIVIYKDVTGVTCIIAELIIPIKIHVIIIIILHAETCDGNQNALIFKNWDRSGAHSASFGSVNQQFLAMFCPRCCAIMACYTMLFGSQSIVMACCQQCRRLRAAPAASVTGGAEQRLPKNPRLPYCSAPVTCSSGWCWGSSKPTTGDTSCSCASSPGDK